MRARGEDVGEHFALRNSIGTVGGSASVGGGIAAEKRVRSACSTRPRVWVSPGILSRQSYTRSSFEPNTSSQFDTALDVGI